MVKVVKTDIKKALQISMVFIAGGFLMACTDDKNTLHTIGGITMPPDPGAAGKATLEGIDSDEDGIRDDVQIAIHKRYPHDKGKRDALKQTAKRLQNSLVAGESGNINKILKLQENFGKITQCRQEKFPHNESYNELLLMEALVANTPERNEAYMEYNQSLSGRDLPAMKFYGKPCEE